MSITVEFKDFEEMKDFARNLLGEQTAPREVAPQTSAPVTSTQPAPGKKDKPVKDEEEKAPDAEPSAVSLEDIRAKLAALNKAGKREQVKGLLSEFGGDKLSQIPEAQYAALMEKVEVL